MFVQLVFLRKAKVMMPVGILLKDLKFLPKKSAGEDEKVTRTFFGSGELFMTS